MGSLADPKTWASYINTKDCSLGFCSLHCPQWCYMMFTPPPPPFVFTEDNSGPSFSPLVIAIIGILASAFLLVSYYAIISKYCGNRRNSSTRQENQHVPDEEALEETQNPPNHEPWHVSNNGLDEALVKLITVCKYKKGEGLIEFTDCSICLSEFQEDESLRLLPKCSHAFHVNCIDTWLKSHSNCPLCRASITFANPLPILSPPPLPPLPDDSDSDSSVVLERHPPGVQNYPPERRNGNVLPLLLAPPLPIFDDSDSDSFLAIEMHEPRVPNHTPKRSCPLHLPPPPPRPIYNDSDTDSSQPPERHEPIEVDSPSQRRNGDAVSTGTSVGDEGFPTRRASSDLGYPMAGDGIIEIREEHGQQPIRRSISMNSSCEAHLSVADVLFFNQDEEFQRPDECRVRGEVGSSKRRVEGMNKFMNRNRVLNCILCRPLGIKRSFSCGRLLFTRRGRLGNVVIPL